MPESPGNTHSVAEMMEIAEPLAEFTHVSLHTVTLAYNQPDAIDDALGRAYADSEVVGNLNREELLTLIAMIRTAKTAQDRLDILNQAAPNWEEDEHFAELAKNLHATVRKSQQELWAQTELVDTTGRQLAAMHQQRVDASEIQKEQKRLAKLFRKTALGIGILAAAGSSWLGIHGELRDMTVLHREHASHERIVSTEQGDIENTIVASLLFGGLIWLGAHRAERKMEPDLVQRRARFLVWWANRRQKKRQKALNPNRNDNGIAS